MDPHPIIVHFPIALLTLYSIFELVRFQRILNKPYWFYVKAILVIAGVLGAIAALVSGLLVAGSTDGPTILVMHFRFGVVTNIVYGLLALSYLSRWLRHSGVHTGLPALPTFVTILLALIGLASITITGGLGGGMVYGTTFDPLMRPVFDLLGIE